MRTTLDIDAQPLAAARALANADGISLGKAVSQLIERGLRPASGDQSLRNGFPVIRASSDHVITDDLVEEHRDD